MKVTISAPWTNGDQEFSDMLGFISQIKMQLEYFRKNGNESQSLKNDLEGYEEILKSKSEKNAEKFLEEKHDRRMTGMPCDNLTVIKYLKETNQWEG